MNIDTLSSTVFRRGRGVGLLVGLLAVALLFTGCDSGGDGGTELENPTDLTIAEVIDARKEISTFKSWLQPTADDAPVNLGDDGSTFTVFIPVNSAFAPLDGEYLNNSANNIPTNAVLSDHIIQGEAIMASDVSEEGEDLVAGDLRLEKASIVTKNLEASNGVVHFIDHVQLKSLNVRQRVGADPTLQAVGAAAGAAGVASDFANEDATFTVFAPTNAAFAPLKLPALLGQPNVLGTVLNSHVVSGEALSSGDLGGATPTSDAGHTLSPNLEAGTIDDQPFEVTDIEASNGVIHKIGGVILNQTTALGRASITAGLGSLTNFVGEAPAVANTLEDPAQTVTVFAPVNSAFAPVDSASFVDADDNLLTNVLQSHVHAGSEVPAGALEEGSDTTVSTLGGRDLTVAKDTAGTITVSGLPGASAEVVTAGIPVKNGRVHLIGGALLDGANAGEVVEIMSATSTLEAQLKGRGVASTLESASQVTAFAPVDGAFAALNDLKPLSDVSDNVFTYHVADGVAQPMVPGGDATVSTLEGADLDVNGLTISSDDSPDGEPGFNGAEAVGFQSINIRASNGFVHMVDNVVLSRATLWERAALEPSLERLATGAQAAGLQSSLDDENQTFTLFGPPNEAFGAYKDTLFADSDILTTAVQSHAVAGQEVRSSDLENGDRLTSLQGTEDGTPNDLRVRVGEPGVFQVNRTDLSTVDVDARNGVVHLVEDVLLHRTNAMERALITPGFETLVSLVERADPAVKDALTSETDANTVLAPTNSAFVAALDTNGTEGLQGEEVPSGGQLDSLLQYHVVDQSLRVEDVPRTQEAYQTLVGSNPGDFVGLVRDAENVVTADPDSTSPATVVGPDVRLSNGWIQALDTMLDNR